ncbi:MAG: hypothetical protein RIC55_22025 [Pirellulaceae bacterium]
MRFAISTILLLLCLPRFLEAGVSQTAESASFVVRSHAGGPSAQQILQECRSLRGDLHALLCGGEAITAWRPRCEVMVHATRSSYLATVGRGGAQTLGSSLTEFSAGRILRRRVDLLADEHNNTPALAHELTHVVLAEQFGGSPPRWADEGLALLADSAHKQGLHMRDLAYALRSGTTLRLGKLLSLDRPESPQQMAAFYAQSLSLVKFLVERDDHQQFLRFVQQAEVCDYDDALRNEYDINGVADLERLWRDSIESREGAKFTPIGRIRYLE